MLQRPEGATVDEGQGPPGGSAIRFAALNGTESLLTRRRREMDSNHQFRQEFGQNH
jgi:hypothetical protein